MRERGREGRRKIGRKKESLKPHSCISFSSFLFNPSMLSSLSFSPLFISTHYCISNLLSGCLSTAPEHINGISSETHSKTLDSETEHTEGNIDPTLIRRERERERGEGGREGGRERET